MPALTPCPIPVELPLIEAAARAGRGFPLGVWMPTRRPFTVVAMRSGQREVLLIDGDLGRLLRRCASILVRLGGEAATVSADELIRVRALRVVAGVPYLPAPAARDALHALFSDARQGARDASLGVEVPLVQRSAEEVLAACAAARTTVLFSQIVYGRIDIGGESDAGRTTHG